MGGAGLAAEVNNPAKPYGRMFVATGNGSYGINPPTISGQPYSNPSNSYGMSVLDLDLTGGIMTVEDAFTPFNEALSMRRMAILAPEDRSWCQAQTLASGKTLNPLSKSGNPERFISSIAMTIPMAAIIPVPNTARRAWGDLMRPGIKLCRKCRRRNRRGSIGAPGFGDGGLLEQQYLFRGKTR